MSNAKRFAKFLLAVLSVPVAGGADTRVAYKIDSEKSKIQIQVAREGFFKAFGHDHLVSAARFCGEVQLDARKIENSSVSFTVQAESLAVVDPGESEKNRKEVQATMLGEQVLDAARYPQIQFSSIGVKVISNKKDVIELQVEGTLSLHGLKKSVAAPVRVQTGEDGTLNADAEVALLQSDFGITPIKVAGGTVRVKDKLRLNLHIVARKVSS